MVNWAGVKEGRVAGTGSGEEWAGLSWGEAGGRSGQGELGLAMAGRRRGERVRVRQAVVWLG